MNQVTRWRAVSLALGATLLVSCGGPKPQQAASAGGGSGAGPRAAAAAATGFGVPECDEYVRQYLACVEGKVPEASRGPMRQALDQMRQSWQEAAKTPEGRAGLAAGCTQAQAAAKISLRAYGCA